MSMGSILETLGRNAVHTRASSEPGDKDIERRIQKAILKDARKKTTFAPFM
jgi:hypothetical protein